MNQNTIEVVADIVDALNKQLKQWRLTGTKTSQQTEVERLVDLLSLVLLRLEEADDA